jgi:hypothetical protein
MGAEPRTAAGKELLGNMIGMRRRVPVQMGLDSSREFTDDILRVEAAAVAAYKAELAEKVRARQDQLNTEYQREQTGTERHFTLLGELNGLDAVLALIEGIE